MATKGAKPKEVHFEPGVDRIRMSKAGKEEALAYQLFFETHIRHTDNEYFGQPFILDDWQLNYLFNAVFGQGHLVKRGAERVFERNKSVIVEGAPRSAGKSDFACGLLITVATMEPVYNGEYAVIAYSKEQASKDFNKLKTMIRLDPELRQLWKPLKNVIINQETGAKIMVMPYSEEALQSWHLNVCILDEVHTYRDDALYQAVVSGQRDIPNALTIVVTTAGKSRSGFLWNKLPEWREEKEVHLAWWGARDDEAIDDRKMWARVHPMSWVSIDKIERQFNKLSQKKFEQYELNRFPLEKSADRALKIFEVRACTKEENPFDFEKPFILGLDAATRGDTFAIVGHQDHDGIDAFHEWCFTEPDPETGYYNINQIKQLLIYLYQEYHCPIYCDPNKFLEVAQDLQDNYGVDIITVAQTNKIMCPASDMLNRSVKEKRARLEGCPVLAEHLTNCLVLYREPFGWRYGSEKHGQGTERIDAAIAAAIAKYATTTVGTTTSFEESGGVWIV